MPVEVASARLRSLVEASGLDITEIAKRAKLSRQAVYRFLRPDYHPLPRGLEAVAAVLAQPPMSLLCETGDSEAAAWTEIRDTLGRAAEGDPRAFEVLPMLLVRSPTVRTKPMEPGSALGHQLLAAAYAVAHAIRPQARIQRLSIRHGAFADPGHAFFFSADLMPPERIVQATPEPMKRHFVFGAFAIEDFARHIHGPA